VYVSVPHKESDMAERPIKEMNAVLNLPDLGLTKAQMNRMKTRFENEIVESLGGKDAVAKMRVRIRVRVVVIIVQE
jgi:hypothetical protein